MIQKCLKWDLPNVISITNIMILVSLYVLISWIDSNLLLYVSIIGAIGAISSTASLILISTVRKEWAKWVSCWALDAHALTFISIIILMQEIESFNLIFLILAIIVLSLSVWSTGIMLDLRTYRVWGAANLFLAWVTAILSVRILLDPTSLLLMLVSTGILLGIITWLAQTNKHILSDDSSLHVS
tara:strand:- start:170 stop:724 length:555 start_codon:yes stop_codon:yes gene_type:complete